jgi:hypothetical protein
VLSPVPARPLGIQGHKEVAAAHRAVFEAAMARRVRPGRP